MEFQRIVQIRKELFDNALPKKTPSGMPEVKVKEPMDITPNPCWEGYEPVGLKPDGSPNCVPIKASKDKMEVVKEGFPVPSPENGESDDAFISRCMHEIGNEYEQSQALAICYSKLGK